MKFIVKEVCTVIKTLAIIGGLMASFFCGVIFGMTPYGKRIYKETVNQGKES